METDGWGQLGLDDSSRKKMNFNKCLKKTVFIKTTDHCGIISVLWRNHHAYYRNGVLNEDGDGVYSVEASKNEYLVKCSVVIDEESLKTLYGELWPDLTTLVAFLSENRRGDLKLVKTLLKI
ncbi:hypothetical protein Zmor_027443 [Zophobas morio]|uniref:Uncharacterized protein n=1 Tax=Zophobas morio TaxID=2755281 RepID=A0AA38M224_9CUCU|nr:hypothetical protein Zmor_027443 [Zophobas morio]